MPAPLLSVITAAYRPTPEWLAAAGASIAATAARAGVTAEWLVRFDGAESVPGWFTPPAGLATRATASDGQRHGIAATRNLALVGAAGAFVAGCDHDDAWEPAGMADVLAAATASGTWAVGRAVDVDADGAALGTGRADPFDAGAIARGGLFDSWQRLGWFPIWCNAAVVAAPLWRAVGGWAALPRSDDLSTWVAVSELTAGVWVPRTAYRWRRHAMQTTEQPWYAAAREDAWAAVRGRVAALRALDVRAAPPPA